MPPSRKKCTAEIRHDFVKPCPDDDAGNALQQQEFARHMTPHHTL